MSVSKSPTQATWYFDVISPFSYLALGEIEELAQRMTVTYRPILFAALLEHWKHLGPAEIPPKRIHTYRLCVFEAQRRGSSRHSSSVVRWGTNRCPCPPS